MDCHKFVSKRSKQQQGFLFCVSAPCAARQMLTKSHPNITYNVKNKQALECSPTILSINKDMFAFSHIHTSVSVSLTTDSLFWFLLQNDNRYR